MYCSRYNRNCEEVLFLCCHVSSNSNNKEEQLQECKEYVFCEVEDEQSRTLDHRSI